MKLDVDTFIAELTKQSGIMTDILNDDITPMNELKQRAANCAKNLYDLVEQIPEEYSDENKTKMEAFLNNAALRMNTASKVGDEKLN